MPAALASSFVSARTGLSNRHWRGAAVASRAGRAVVARRPGVFAVAVTQKPDVTEPSNAEGVRIAAAAGGKENAALSYEYFESLLEKYDFKFKTGDKVTGEVFKLDNKGAYIDIGAKAAAFCPIAELSLCAVSRADEVVAVGERREFIIIRDEETNSGDACLLISIKKAQLDLAWQRIRQMQAEDVTTYGKIVAINRGGILVETEHLRGFVPTSHLSTALRTPTEAMVGTSIPFKYLEVDQERTRLVLSNKKAQVEKEAKTFKVGTVLVGVVNAVKPYGAFVDVGGVNGLLHISQISSERITNVENVLTVGDKIKVMVLGQDDDRGRISLSTKKLEPTPGDMVKNPAVVFEKAEEMAVLYLAKQEAAEAGKAALAAAAGKAAATAPAAPAEDAAVAV